MEFRSIVALRPTLFVAILAITSNLSVNPADAQDLLQRATSDRPLPVGTARIVYLGYAHIDPTILRSPTAGAEIKVILNLSAASAFQNFPANQLPEADMPLSLRRADSADIEVWTGSVEGSSHRTVTMGVSGREFSLSAHLDRHTVIIARAPGVPRADDGRDVFLVELRERARLPNESPPRVDRQIGGSTRVQSDRQKAEECARIQEPKEIRVLVFFTKLARERVGETRLRTEIGSHFAIQETLMRDSAVRARLVLAGTPEELKLAERGGLGGMLNRFTTNVRAKELRDQRQADIVSLISLNKFASCGLAWQPGRLYRRWARAFGVIPHECMVEQYSLLHEIGHNLGAGHAHSRGIFSYSRGLKVPATRQRRGFSTLMTYPGARTPRIARWSNPETLYDNVKTGTATRNNARTVNETRCTAAEWR